MIINEKLEKEKMALHLKYISAISCGCICLVIILSCCESTMFQNCISVASTVTSIILSAVAIFLSVTGERTTNEIRNKVSDSVNQLEFCTEKSSQLTDELTKTIQLMNQLYENVNDKIVEQIPQMQSTLNDLVSLNKGSNVENIKEDDIIEHIVRFLNIFNKEIQQYVKMSYSVLITATKEKPVSMEDIINNLMNNGASHATANFIVGIMLGNMSTGTINDKINDLIDKL